MICPFCKNKLKYFDGYITSFYCTVSKNHTFNIRKDIDSNIQKYLYFEINKIGINIYELINLNDNTECEIIIVSSVAGYTSRSVIKINQSILSQDVESIKNKINNILLLY